MIKTALNPILSIVTVTFNDREGVLRTLESIERALDVRSGEVECLVKDGGTSGGLDDLAKAFPWAKIISSPDRGTYDAMNTALALTRGRYVWFLNGGDEVTLTSWSRLRGTLREETSLLFFDYYRAGSKTVEYRRARGSRYIRHALPTSHQAILYPGESARSIAYDLSYPVSADYEFTARLMKGGLRARRVRQPIAKFYLGGLSSRRRAQIAHDANRVQREVLGTTVARRMMSSAKHRAVSAVMDIVNPASNEIDGEIDSPVGSEVGNWRADRARYPSHSLLTQPGLWAIGVYRFGRWTRLAPRPLKPIVHAVYFAAYSVVRLATGIDIPRSVAVGPGLMIHHFGGIVVNPQCVIGARCTLRQGVTLGSRIDDGPVPVIGNDVDFGVYAQVLGGVVISDGARIGAMALVLSDVPTNATAVGVPARIISKQAAGEALRSAGND